MGLALLPGQPFIGKIGILRRQIPGHLPGGSVGGQGGEQDERQIAHAGKQVKGIAGRKQQNPLPLPGDPVIQDQQYRREQRKTDRRETHQSISSRSIRA